VLPTPVINGPEVTADWKRRFARSGAKHVVSCASGTDALLMVLMARTSGRAMRCQPVLTCATGEAVALTGATPVFVDVDEAFHGCRFAQARHRHRSARFRRSPSSGRPSCQSADHDAVPVAAAEGLFVPTTPRKAWREFQGPQARHLGLATATSFPAKPLGFWHGGAIFTDDERIADAALDPRARPGFR
jgi:hypothetical protein